jgi:cytochrome c556
MRRSIVALALLGGCSPFCLPSVETQSGRPTTAVDDASPLPLAVSVKDMMDGVTAFSAHVVEQVSDTDAALTKSDWGAAGAASSDLTAVATLLTMPNGSATDTLRRQDPEWRELAKALQDAGIETGVASRLGDRQRLASAVSAVRAACQACHAKYGVHGQ